MAPYVLGDAELVLTGLAAAVAARWHARRKDYRLIPSDPAALDWLRRGLELGATMPLDDVPDIRVAIAADPAAVEQLKAIVAAHGGDTLDTLTEGGTS